MLDSPGVNINDIPRSNIRVNLWSRQNRGDLCTQVSRQTRLGPTTFVFMERNVQWGSTVEPGGSTSIGKYTSKVVRIKLYDGR